ncbi:B-cell receptor CD22 [Tiliqua scincoides]|uniref:B-cell receptor CD22 n=1 Tax=Tiliqua scincoides TaxID=71010 RepID=UPI0034629212
MRCLFGLLFLPGVLCYRNPLKINPSSLRTWNGSCVVIPCIIYPSAGRLKLDIISLIWYFEPTYNTDLKDFDGTMLYNASRNPPNNMVATSPTFKGRVRFVGNLEQKNCSLKISQLRKNDSGVYMPRLYGMLETKKADKWALDVPIDVQEPPPGPTIEINPLEVKERQTTKVICSMPYHCPDEPLRLILSGLEKRGRSPQEANEMGKIQTTLTFTPGWEDHGRTLRCSLSHQDGSVISQSTLLLNVNYAPRGQELKATPSKTIQEGEKLSLECTVLSSNPPVQYHWYKDHAESYEWRGPKIEFNPVEEHHAGTYKCEVANTFGRSEKEVKIDIQYSPKETTVTVTPSDIKEGVNVVLHCSSRGNPTVDRYEWYKSTQSSPLGTTKWLSLERIRPSDSGIYYCITWNQLGNSSSTPVTLDVPYPPKNVQLANQNPLTVEEGETVTLNCSVGRSNPPVTWYKWSDNARDKTKRENLLIFQAAGRDAGSYHCEACNSVQCTQSTPISVDVLYGPKDVSVVQEPRGRLHEGSRVQMSCIVGRANPKELTFVWYKDDQQLQLNPAGATRTISKVTPDDSGTYSCEAKNSMGKSRSSAATLDVLYGPRKVYVSLSTLESVTEGTDVKMLCKSDANPVAYYYEWSWNDEWKSLENSKILTLPKVQVNQAGTYRCRAKNTISVGESGALHLTVWLSRATVLKQTLIGLGVALFLVMFLGFLIFGLRNCKKVIHPGTGQTRRASFFVKKAKGENFCRNNRSNEVQTDHSLGFLNQGAEADISYSTIRFPPSSSEDGTEYACIKGPRLAMSPADDTVIYSAVKKPRLPANGDAKHDYENVENNQEEEVHYSTLMNLARQPCPTYRDSDTDSESEESIQYASLKH